jgi:hypothetical protein
MQASSQYAAAYSQPRPWGLPLLAELRLFRCVRRGAPPAHCAALHCAALQPPLQPSPPDAALAAGVPGLACGSLLQRCVLHLHGATRRLLRPARPARRYFKNQQKTSSFTEALQGMSAGASRCAARPLAAPCCCRTFLVAAAPRTHTPQQLPWRRERCVAFPACPPLQCKRPGALPTNIHTSPHLRAHAARTARTRCSTSWAGGT